MAKVVKSVLGKVSGSLGDLTFKQVGGKNIIAMRPSKYTAGSDEGSLLRRDKFRLAVKFSSAITSIIPLRLKWNSSTPDKISKFGYIVKKVYPCINASFQFDNCSILPVYDFYVNLESVQFDVNSVNIKFSAPGNLPIFDPVTERKIKLLAVAHLNEPAEDKTEKYRFLSLQSQEIDFQPGNSITIQINFNQEEKSIIEKYNSRKIFFCIATFNHENKPVHYSKAYSS